MAKMVGWLAGQQIGRGKLRAIQLLLPFRSIMLPLFLSLRLSDWLAQNETKSFQEILHAREHKWADCRCLPRTSCLDALKDWRLREGCQAIFRLGMHPVCKSSQQNKGVSSSKRGVSPLGRTVICREETMVWDPSQNPRSRNLACLKSGDVRLTIIYYMVFFAARQICRPNQNHASKQVLQFGETDRAALGVVGTERRQTRRRVSWLAVNG